MRLGSWFVFPPPLSRVCFSCFFFRRLPPPPVHVRRWLCRTCARPNAVGLCCRDGRDGTTLFPAHRPPLYLPLFRRLFIFRREEYIEKVRGAAKKSRNPYLSVIWTEGGAQPALEEATGLTFGYPAVIAVSVEKKARASPRRFLSAPLLCGVPCRGGALFAVTPPHPESIVDVLKGHMWMCIPCHGLPPALHLRVNNWCLSKEYIRLDYCCGRSRRCARRSHCCIPTTLPLPLPLPPSASNDLSPPSLRAAHVCEPVRLRALDSAVVGWCRPPTHARAVSGVCGTRGVVQRRGHVRVPGRPYHRRHAYEAAGGVAKDRGCRGEISDLLHRNKPRRHVVL